MVAEEIDAMAGELSGRLEVVEAELSDVRKRLEKLYEAIETSELTLEVLSPRILSLRHREMMPSASLNSAGWSCRPRRRSRSTWRTSETSWRKGLSPSARRSFATSWRASRSTETRLF